MTTCKPAGDNRRIIPDEHYDQCDNPTCPGCWPCYEDHCLVCRYRHTTTTCPTCIHNTRDDLHQIEDLCLRLPNQAITIGLNGEHPDTILGGDAMVALAMRYPDQNGMAGAWHNDWHRDESPADITPPLVTLTDWEDVFRRHLNHHTDQPASIGAALTYLEQQLTYMAGVPDVPFADFAGDIRRLRTRLQSVVHDQNRGDPAGVACFDCGGDLERKLTERRHVDSARRHDTGGFEDHWTCQRCSRRYTYAEYNFALRAKLEEAS